MCPIQAKLLRKGCVDALENQLNWEAIMRKVTEWEAGDSDFLWKDQVFTNACAWIEKS